MPVKISMPELPEVEVLVRHLRPLLKGRTIQKVVVGRPRVVRGTTVLELTRALEGARFGTVTRRAKYLVFTLTRSKGKPPLRLVGHLGMTGRMYLLPADAPRPKHLAVELDLGRHSLIFEDTRYFGRLTLDGIALEKLGPEPLGREFTSETFFNNLRRSSQAIKVRLLDQSLVAGVGNIYASEALFRAGISPRRAARRLNRSEVERLWRALRDVLAESIAWGSTVPLNLSGQGRRDGLFYYGSERGAVDLPPERLLVYDREGQPCPKCRTPIKRIVQAGRSTFYCPNCQRRSSVRGTRSPAP